MLSLLFYLLVYTSRVLCDIVRRDGSFIGDFKVLNHGRMHYHTILMWLDDISREECFYYCFGHLRCETVNYSSIARLCELVDMEFDETEADTEATGWVNYGVPAKIDGGYSPWVKWTECDRTCGEGVTSLFRICDNPKPEYGGDDCHGNDVKTAACYVQGCPVHGGWGAWGGWTICSTTCGTGTKARSRSCSSPAPQHGGDDCTGDKSEALSCVIKKCLAADFCKSIGSGATVLDLYNSNGDITDSGNVECKIINGQQFTLFSHDALATRRFDSSNHKGDQNLFPITWSNNLAFVRKAVQQFDYCLQYFNFKAAGVYRPSACFLTYRQSKLCANDDRCHGCHKIDNSGKVRQGRASVDDKALLPFSAMEFQDTDDKDEFAEISLEKLKCR